MAPSETSVKHQHLLDLEEAISEASSFASLYHPHKSGAGSSRPPTRPSSARPASVRPASATSEGCRARRPSSARGGRPPSSAASTASGRSAASSAHSMASTASFRSTTSLHGAVERSVQDHSKGFTQICELIGTKAAQRFRSVQECFRFLDQDHNGLISRSEMREFCHVLNISREFADRFFDMLDVNRRGEIDFPELAPIFGPYIQPGYQAAGTRRSAPAPRAPHDDQERGGEFDPQLIEMLGSKASQKYRTVTDCFRFLDEDKTGRVTRDKCRRLVEELGFKPSVGDSLFRYMAGSHREVDFLKFSETFGPYIQPGYGSAPAVRQRRPSSGGGSSWRSATPPPYRVERQTPSGRQRPQSARPAGRGGRSKAAADVHAAAEWSQKVVRSGSSAGSLCSASTASAPRSSGSSSEADSDRVAPGVYCDPRPCRAEVTDRHIGSYMYLPETPRAVNNNTWDSSQVKKRMVQYPESDVGRVSRSSPHAPQPPSAPRPHTAGGRYRKHRPREVEAYDDVLSAGGSFYETSTPSHYESPHESRYSPAQGTYIKDYNGALIRTEPLPTASTGDLYHALEQRWSVL